MRKPDLADDYPLMDNQRDEHAPATLIEVELVITPIRGRIDCRAFRGEKTDKDAEYVWADEFNEFARFWLIEPAGYACFLVREYEHHEPDKLGREGACTQTIHTKDVTCSRPVNGAGFPRPSAGIPRR